MAYYLFRLKVHYLVGDSTGTTSVVFWDKLAHELLNKTAPELKEILLKACVFVLLD